jgi:hypothetical protein
MSCRLGVDAGLDLDGRLLGGSVSSQAVGIVDGAGSGTASVVCALARRRPLGRVAAPVGRRPVSLGRVAPGVASVSVSVCGWMVARGFMVTRDALDGASVHRFSVCSRRSRRVVPVERYVSCQGSRGVSRSCVTYSSSRGEARCV